MDEVIEKVGFSEATTVPRLIVLNSSWLKRHKVKLYFQLPGTFEERKNSCEILCVVKRSKDLYTLAHFSVQHNTFSYCSNIAYDWLTVRDEFFKQCSGYHLRELQ